MEQAESRGRDSAFDHVPDALNARQYAEAGQMAQQVISSHPDLDLGYVWAASAYSGTQKYEEARSILTEGLKRAKRNTFFASGSAMQNGILATSRVQCIGGLRLSTVSSPFGLEMSTTHTFTLPMSPTLSDSMMLPARFFLVLIACGLAFDSVLLRKTPCGLGSRMVTRRQ
jgi:tetratricopeptide (TPR) repeat protein